MRPITAATAVFAVIGDPVRHSLSPVMHNAWIAAAGLDAAYVALPVPAHANLQGLRTLGLAGVNVTIPHKEAAAALADRRIGAAETLGAANVLSFREGEIVAHNTDAPGFTASLDDAAPGWDAGSPTALVIGAGGAGRAIASALAARGAACLIANRTQARAEALAALAPGMQVLPWNALAEGFAAADVIVNATSLGLGVVDGGGAWPFARARPGAIAVDAVYRPLKTAFLLAAEANGLRAVDGLGMLLHQGALAFEIWFDRRPDVAAGRALLERTLAEKQT